MNNTLSTPFNPLNQENDAVDVQAYAVLVRNRVREIITSYHHQFDQLYECIQNAVDACEKQFHASEVSSNSPYLPLVKVIIDLPSNTLTVIDNGSGMSGTELRMYYFTPNATLKSSIHAESQPQARQRGEKGVGAAFLAYGSNHIQITTISSNTHELTAGQLDSGRKWCFGQCELLPMPEVTPCLHHSEMDTMSHGTAVTLAFTDDAGTAKLSEYGVDWNQWETILRLFTAIGYVDFQSNDPFFKSLNASLTLITDDGNQDTRLVKTGFLFPHLTTPSNIQQSSLVRLNGNKLAQSQKDMSVLWDRFTYEQVDADIVARLNNSPYMRHKEKERITKVLKEHKPEAYVAFTYGSGFWDVIN